MIGYALHWMGVARPEMLLSGIAAAATSGNSEQAISWDRITEVALIGVQAGVTLAILVVAVYSNLLSKRVLLAAVLPKVADIVDSQKFDENETRRLIQAMGEAVFSNDKKSRRRLAKYAQALELRPAADPAPDPF